MKNFFTLYSPLEQFQIVPIINLALRFLGIDCSVTNESVILIIVFLILFIVFVLLLKKDGSFSIIPGKIQSILEFIYTSIGSVSNENIQKLGSKNPAAFVFPILAAVFFYVLSLNLIGLVPYSFTLTSHLVVTLALSISLFIGLIIIGIKVKGKDFVKMFFPGGTSIILSLLLVPVEILSFIFKPISLGVRLFANMMAGHTLLKVIGGFIMKFIAAGSFFFLLMFIPTCILVPLFGLELGVAFIQTLVIITLLAIYIQSKIGDDH